jgi:Lon protease-like protein
LGLSRARVLGELPPDRPFREARLELMPDVSPSAPASDPSAVHDELIALFRRFLAHEKSIRKQVEELLGKQASLGLLTDVVAFTLALDPSQKQRLLAEPNVDRRSRMLVRHLSERLKRKGPRRERGFPPEFSAN